MLKYFGSVQVKLGTSPIDWSGNNLANHRQTPAWLNRWASLDLAIAFFLTVVVAPIPLAWTRNLVRGWPRPGTID